LSDQVAAGQLGDQVDLMVALRGAQMV